MRKRCRASPWIHAGLDDLCSSNEKVFPNLCWFRSGGGNLIKSVAKFRPNAIKTITSLYYEPFAGKYLSIFPRDSFSFLVPRRSPRCTPSRGAPTMKSIIRYKPFISLASFKLARFVSFRHSALLSNHWLTSFPTNDGMRERGVKKASKLNHSQLVEAKGNQGA